MGTQRPMPASSSSATGWSATGSSRPPSNEGCDTERGLVVVGEERRRAYDRVHLSSLFDGVGADDLALGDGRAVRPRRRRARARRPGRRRSTSTGASGDDRSGRPDHPYDACVLATGSSPFVPPDPRHRCRRCVRLPDHRRPRRRSGRGRTAAAAASSSAAGSSGWRRPTRCGCSALDTTVVEFAPHLMAVQLDPGAGRGAASPRRGLGIERAHRRRRHRRAARGRRSRDRACELGDDVLDADLVVFAAGLRPRDQLGSRRRARRRRARRHRRRRPLPRRRPLACTPSARSPAIAAGCTGSSLRVTPWPRSSPTAWPVVTSTFTGADLSTTLKLLGVDVASAGNPHADGHEVVVADAARGHLAARRGRRRGSRPRRQPRRRHGRPTRCSCRRCGARCRPPDVLASAAPGGRRAPRGPADLPDEAGVCSCHNVSCGTVRAAVDEGFEDVAGVKSCTKAGTGCGSCVPCSRS